MDFGKNDKKITELYIFLVRRFIITAMFIYTMQQVVGIIYQRVFMYLMVDVMEAGAIQYKGNALFAAGSLLVLVVWNMVSGKLPNFLVSRLTVLFQGAFHARIQAPAFVSQYGEGMVNLYYVTLILIILIQLLINLAPYVLGAMWYIGSIYKKMEEIREDDRRQKAEYDKQRNLMFSDIVHDIKTPVTTINGYTRALLDGLVTDPAKEREYLQAINGKSMRISDLISTLFEYVKLDSAGFELHTKECDLAELVRETVIVHFMDFEEKGLEMDFDIPEESKMAVLDYMQMSRVVTNLLTNTIRYLSEGDRVLVSMKETVYKGKPMYLVAVADDGIAIEDGLVDTIFEPFSRGDKARATKGGSGLGLSIANKVARMHGGDLVLNQPCGDGYTKAFEIYIPIPEAKGINV